MIALSRPPAEPGAFPEQGAQDQHQPAHAEQGGGVGQQSRNDVAAAAA